MSASVISSIVQILKENLNKKFHTSGLEVFCHILSSNAVKSAKFVTHTHPGYCTKYHNRLLP